MLDPFLTVFPVVEGETAPELDAVYRQFREKMSGLAFRAADEGAVGNSMVYIAATQYDFRAAINEAMLAAMEAQCQGNGNAFADYAGWMSQGFANAAMGEEEISEADGTGELDAETVAGLNEFYGQFAQQTPGFYAGVSEENGRIVTRVGIDFQTAAPKALVDAGVVSGNYQGNMTDGWLSLAGAINSFEKAGMTSTTTPVYETKK